MEELWLARDKDGCLRVYSAKPWKTPFIWICSEGYMSMILDRNLFPEVQWSDEEPTKVKLVIVK